RAQPAATSTAATTKAAAAPEATTAAGSADRIVTFEPQIARRDLGRSRYEQRPAQAGAATGVPTAEAALCLGIGHGQILDRDSDRHGGAGAGPKRGDEQPPELVVARQAEIVAEYRDVLLHNREVARGQRHVRVEADCVAVLRRCQRRAQVRFVVDSERR